MRVLILFLAACSAWGQIAFNYATINGSSGSTTVLLDGAVDAYAVSFTAPTATSVSDFAVYSSARATANVDALRAQVVEMCGSTIGCTITYNDGSDLINFTNNSLSNGDIVRFAASTTLPAGLAINTDYHVCNRAATNFQVDDDAGCGSVVTDFSGSAGNQYFVKVISASTTFTPSPVTAATWIDFSSFSAHTLVAGRKYAVMLLNVEAVPATDSITIQYANNTQPSFLPYTQGGVLGVAAVTISQAMSSIPTGRATGYVTLSSGVVLGSPFNTNQTGANARINGTREVGAKFTVPANVSFNVNKIGGQIQSFTGTTYPTGLTYKLYSVGGGTDTVVDSCDVSLYLVTGFTTHWCYFTTSRALTPGGTYRIVASATSSAGDSSNYVVYLAYAYRSGATVDIPWSTAWTYCAATCTSTANWTNSSTDTASFIIGLDDSTPFASTGSGLGGGAYVVAQ